MVRINPLRNDEQTLSSREMTRVMGGKRKHRHEYEVETIVRTQYVPVYTPVYSPVVRPLQVMPTVADVRYLPDGTRILVVP